MKLNCILFLLFIGFQTAAAQELFSNQRVKRITISSSTVQLDSLSILPGSLNIVDSAGNVVPSNFFSLLAESGKVIFSSEFLKDSSFIKKRFIVSYKVFPFLFSKNYEHKDSNVFKPDETGKPNPYVYKGEQKNNSDIFASEGLNKSGSITRGLALGNNQDVVLNSNLNLQLSGKLTDKISILAAIADDNIPIQPDGNTQQLQEFDRVYIQFNDEKSKLIAGDFQLLRPNSYFLNYFKKSQGASFSSALGLGKTAEQQKENRMNVSLSAAVSKGKFSRNVILGVEGNQGPYRLNGAENEAFVIILSGTEKVYIDGQLLERGQENDYVIDYNTAEITFTPKRKITKDKRITAEFQYSDKNYARSLFEVGNEYKNKNLSLRLHVFSEQDNKKKPLLQELKSNEKKILSEIGDNLQSAIVSSIDTTGYLPNTVLYKVVDSLGFSKVFVYSTDSSNAIYRLRFSNVGLGNGNYNPINTSANGKVYQWIAPINGQKQGAYEPVVLLITPKKKQMVTFGVDYKLARNFTSTLELAYSTFDKNTFSDSSSKDDDGYAMRALLQKKTRLSGAETDSFNLITGANLELVSTYFSPVERYRNVEFDREWNRGNASLNKAQTIGGAQIGIEKKSLGKAIYQLNGFKELTSYTGLRHEFNADAKKKGYDITASASLLNSSSDKGKSSYLKYRSLASKKISFLKIGAGIEQEESRFYTNTDSIFTNSFRFLEWQAFVQTADTSKNSFGVRYINRVDWLPETGSFNKTNQGQSVEASLGLAKNENSVLKISGTYRSLEIKKPTLSALVPDNSLVSRIEYGLKVFKGTISLSTFYEVGSGLEVKKEYSFIKVQPGQGIYQWVDADNDSLQDIDEFFIAVFQDKAEYLKVFTPTSDFVKTYNNQFNQILTLSPAKVWNNKKGIRKIMALLSNQTVYRVDRKTSNNDAEKFLNPFLVPSKDKAIVTLNSAFRNTLIFNRFNSKFGFDYSYLENKNKTLLVNGTEQRTLASHTIKSRWNIARKWLVTIDASNGTKTSTVQFFSSRNFHIAYFNTEPTLSFQPNTTFRISVSYQYSDKMNKSQSGNDSLLNGISALGQKLGTELKYNKAQKGSLSTKFNFILLKYNGTANSSLSYEMLEGLQPGKNYTWSLSYQRTLSNNIQLNLSYDGRKSGLGRIVHIGNAQVRAFF